MHYAPRILPTVAWPAAHLLCISTLSARHLTTSSCFWFHPLQSADEDEDAAAEEEEALRLQQQQAAQLAGEDFGLEEDEEGQVQQEAAEKKKQQQKKKKGSKGGLEVEQVAKDLSALTQGRRLVLYNQN